MGCMSHRRSDGELRAEQKWDYIQLNDFKSGNFFTYTAYGYLYFSLLLSVAVYSVDTFTAINLLVFNKWSSEIEPPVSFDITKWIFSICIILSFVNLAYEHIRAQRIMRRGSVAECFLDNLAVRLECIRFGSGKGWRRFLVFAELTKSKKGAEYIALFTFFSFQAWIRVIFCSGPRQAVNAITLYSVYTAKLSVQGDNFETSLSSLFAKIKALAESDYQQALILSGMIFTLVIWVFSALSLLIAAMFFVFFLWGWIPRNDGGLSGYCSRKINKRLMKIVSVKVNKAIEDQERQRKKMELRAAKKAGVAPAEERKATLPNISGGGDDKLPDMPMLNRNDTMATLPAYTSRPGTPGSIELARLDQLRPQPSRMGTGNSRVGLMGAGAEMGRSSPAPSMPPQDINNYPPARAATAGAPYGAPPPLSRVQTNQSNQSAPAAFGPPPPLNRAGTNQTHRSNNSTQSNQSGFGAQYTETPGTYSPDTFPPMPQPTRSPTSPIGGYPGMPPRSNMTPAPRPTNDDYYNANGRSSPAPGPLRQMTSRPQFDEYSQNGRSSPAPSANWQNRGQTQSPGPMGPPGGYPVRSATNPYGPGGPGLQAQQPQRNMTAPVQGRFPQGQPPNGEFRSFTPGHRGQPSGGSDYRPGTANSQRTMNQRPGYGNGGNGWNGDLEGGQQQGQWPGPRY